MDEVSQKYHELRPEISIHIKSWKVKVKTMDEKKNKNIGFFFNVILLV